MGEYVEGNDVCPKGLENPEDKIKRVRAWVEGRDLPLLIFAWPTEGSMRGDSKVCAP